jgi:hypothetical protein
MRLLNNFIGKTERNLNDSVLLEETTYVNGLH